MWRSLLFTALVYSSTLAAQEQGKYLTDNSDWWSLVRVDSYGIVVKPGHTELDKKNFSIGGSPLGSSFRMLTAKFGKATEVSRGDAASGRHQVCYEATRPNSKQYLVFEFGEVEETFYLFEDGPSWIGEEQCTKSSSKGWVTPTGLKLGINRSKVEEILGKPDAVERDRIVYLRETKHNLSPQEFAQMRKNYPQLSDQEAHEQLDYFDLTAFIDARFSNSKLIYLAVSKTEIN
jgi:hypothetical protein